ncbi:MAG: rhodanese-like domain-containing protein [Alistipes sp.]|nr:rhodanese-like domain-containing protein [Alistipes sp.]
MKRLFLVIISTLFCALFGCNADNGFKSVDVKHFARVIAREEVQLVDVRTPEEYAEGHIVGAVNMDVKSEAFDTQLATLDPKRPVALYCRGGRRSKMAAERAVKAGFKVFELDKGYLSWQAYYAEK